MNFGKDFLVINIRRKNGEKLFKIAMVVVLTGMLAPITTVLAKNQVLRLQRIEENSVSEADPPKGTLS